MTLPGWLQDKLATPPAAGAGVHAWLFSCARQLHAHLDPAAIFATLRAATANCGRRVTDREIRDAVNNSLAVAWVPSPKGFQPKERAKHAAKAEKARHRDGSDPHCAPSDRWPKPDAIARRNRIADSAADGITGAVDLWERSPIRPDLSADDWIDWLFPSAEWLCLAVDHPATARSKRREKWSFGPADECGLVVPSPMTGPSGLGLDGRTSHRCLGNTGARRWLVVEFDKLEDGKTNMPIDEQAALHWHFREASVAAGWPRLRLVVHSGGKSLHGWYGPCTDEEQSRDLMAYAVSLGADPATWVPCQLVRLPGGVRVVDGERVRQEVLFYDRSGLL